MKFCVIIINDGRNDYLEKSLKSFSENVIFPEDSDITKILIDDWPIHRDEKTIKKIGKKHGVNKFIFNETNLKVDNTVHKIWSCVPEDIDYIFHQENDFIYLEKVYISELMKVLESPVIVQCALARQAWFKDELESGSLFNTRPERFRSGNIAGLDIVMHKDHFTFNPSLYKRKWLVNIDPFGEYQLCNHYLSQNSALWFTYLGKRTDKNRIEHIGEIKK